MFAVRPLIVLLLILSGLALLAGCQTETTTEDVVENRSLGRNFQWLPMFGDGANDATEVIAKVGDIEITSRDLKLYLDELPSTQQSRYIGSDGERLLLKRMVEYSILVQSAVERKLYNDPDVARTIIAQRRNALQSAMVNVGLLRDAKPSEEEIREYFMNHRGNFRQLGAVNARHIECRTKAEAEKAYQRLIEGGKGNDWVSVMVETTVNQESKGLDGSTGWFNQGSVIPFIMGSQKFSNRAYGLDLGLHPPFMISDRWHVVEILGRENERPMTFSEARGQAETQMMPAWQDGLVRDYLLEARETYPVQRMGRFSPGQGMTVEELFAQANAVADGERKIALLNLIHTDYPESDRADDALFMAALAALDTWQDVRVAQRYLRVLLEEYPDSDLREDAEFLRDNIYNPEVLNPKSIEDLRK